MWAFLNPTRHIEARSCYDVSFSSLSQAFITLNIFCSRCEFVVIMPHISNTSVYIQLLSNLINNFVKFVDSLLSGISRHMGCSSKTNSRRPNHRLNTPTHRQKSSNWCSGSSKFNLIVNVGFANLNIVDCAICFTTDWVSNNV